MARKPLPRCLRVWLSINRTDRVMAAMITDSPARIYQLGMGTMGASKGNLGCRSTS
jgi:hypothetical protein